jgi:hypothetical protein
LETELSCREGFKAGAGSGMSLWCDFQWNGGQNLLIQKRLSTAKVQSKEQYPHNRYNERHELDHHSMWK